MSRLLVGTLLLNIFHFGPIAPTAHAAMLEWVRQFGGGGGPNAQAFEQSKGVSADGFGNVYIGGWYATAIGGQAQFVRKYDSAGDLQWERKIDNAGYDSINGVSTDGQY